MGKQAGVYMIFCVKNRKAYIGSSRWINRRLWSHKTVLRKKKHPNSLLQEAWNTYGEGSFLFSALEVLNNPSSLQLLQRETYWILFYESQLIEKGFNMYMADNSPPEEDLEIVNYKVRGKPIYSINMLTKEVVKHDSTLIAVRKTGVGKKAIEKCINYWDLGRHYFARSSKNYMFVREVDYKEDFDYLTYKRPRKLKGRKVRCFKKKPEDIIPYEQRNIFRKKIVLVNKETGEEKVASSIKGSVREFGLTLCKVRICLKRPFRERSHKGYWIKYAE